MAIRTCLCTQIFGPVLVYVLKFPGTGDQENNPILGFFAIKMSKPWLDFYCIRRYIIAGQFAMSHGSYNLNLGSEILGGDIRSGTWFNIGDSYGNCRNLAYFDLKKKYFLKSELVFFSLFVYQRFGSNAKRCRNFNFVLLVFGHKNMKKKPPSNCRNF
mgnify:CR=1 FL=1